MRVAINPLQWVGVGRGRQPDDLDAMLAEVAAAGFTAIHAAVPDGTSPAAYRERLRTHGLAPAPGYVSGDLDDPGARAEQIERGRRDAAAYAELGLREVFLAGNLTPERIRRPARSAAEPLDTATLDAIAETVTAVAAAMAAEGVLPCLHDHVGSLVESEAELEHVLAATDPAVVRIGPDTGHLAWAGADPAAFLARHRDRIGAIHLKDVRLGVAERGRAEDLDYGAQVALGLWAELGLGDLPLLECVRTVAPSDVWVVVEVDRASLDTPLASARACRAWLDEAERQLAGG